MDIFGILALVVCFFMYKKIDHLEKRIQESNQFTKKIVNPAEDNSQDYSIQEDKKGVKESFESISPEETEKEEGALVRLAKWMATDWLMKLGAFLLILAFAWFVSYAFINNWIGPIGRITLGIVAGVLVLLLGEWRIKKSVDQGGVFLVLGGTIILLTIFAAREIYDFFTPAAALLVMSSVVVFIALSSIRHKSPKLAILSLVMGAIAPLLTNTPDPSMLGLLSYLFVLSAGTIWVVVKTGWRILTPLSLFIVFIYNIPYFQNSLSEKEELIGLVFAFLFVALFYIFNLVLIIFHKKAKKADLIVALMNGFFILLWINIVVVENFKSSVTMLTALLFAIGAYAVFKKSKLKEPVMIYSGIAVALFAAATAFELSGSALVIAFTLEAGLLATIFSYISRNARIGQDLSLLLLFPAFLSLNSFVSASWHHGVLHDDFFVLLTFAIITLVLGIQLYMQSRKDSSNVIPGITNSIFVVSAIYCMSLVWLSLEAGIANNDTAHMIALIIYTLAGLVFYIRGIMRDRLYFRWVGGLLLGVVVFRLLFVEAWKMDLSGRIITFFVVAILLIATAFISKKNDK